MTHFYVHMWVCLHELINVWVVCICYHAPWKTPCSLEALQAGRPWLATVTLKTWITL